MTRPRIESGPAAAASRIRRSALAVLVVVAALPALAQTPRAGGELGYGEGPPSLGNLNPYASLARNGPTDRVLSMIYEPLFRFNFNTESWENVLAEDLKKVPARSGKSAFEVSLRKASWHDGTPFTATDVVFTYDYIRKAAANQMLRKQFNSVLTDVREGDSPSKVVFEFRDTVSDARFHLLDFIIPASKFNRSTFMPLPDATLDLNPVGTGPYKFSKFISGWPFLGVYDAFHAEKGYLATIRSRGFSDQSSMIESFLTQGSGVNMLVEVSPEDLPKIETSGGATLQRIESYNVFAVAMRQTPGSILASDKVRRAITMAVNRPQIVKTWFGSKATELASPVVPSAPFYDATVKPLVFDTVAAKRDLREAGAIGGRPLTFIYQTGESGADMRTANAVHSIKEALEAVGLKVVERPLISAQFERTLLDRGDFDLAWVRWEFNPAYDITPFFVSENRQPGGLNYMLVNDQEIDRLSHDYEEAGGDAARRQSLMRRLQQILNAKAPAIFLVNEEKTYVYNSRYRVPTNDVDPFHFFTYVNKWWLAPGK